MSDSEGFKPAGQNDQLSAEYVLTQREEVVKKFQQEVLDLKDKIAVLKGKAASLEADLVLAFSERLKAVERRENESKEVSQKTFQEKMALDQEKKAFEIAKDKWSEDHQIGMNEITARIRENESLLETIRENQKQMDIQENRVNDYGARILQREEEAARLKILLNGQEKNIDLKRQELISIESELNNLRKSIREEEEVLSVSRSINKNQMSELDDLRKRLEISKKEAEESSEKLKSDIEQNKLIYQAGVDVAKGNKEKHAQLIDLESKLKIFGRDLSLKKEDLDTRESRIKDLEKRG